MGQSLSLYPISSHTLTLGNHHELAFATTRGHRQYQEDTHTITEYKNIPFITANEIQNIKNVKIFGVFDGHGGHLTSHYLKRQFSKSLIRNLQKDSNCNNREDGYDDVMDNDDDERKEYRTNHKLIIQRIKNTFWELDIELYEYLKNDLSGSTAIISLIINDKDLYSINLGDSRLLLGLNNGNVKILSYDHKPNHIGELIRINENKSFIQNNRIQGILALSRSFGDFEFKIGDNLYETSVIVEPEIICHEINQAEDKFLVLGSDGVFEIFNNRQLIKILNKGIKNGISLKDLVVKVLNETMMSANNETGCGFDNMTMILYEL